MRSKPRLSKKKNKSKSFGPMVACAFARARARVHTPVRLRVHAATAGDAMLNFVDRDAKTK